MFMPPKNIKTNKKQNSYRGNSQRGNHLLELLRCAILFPEFVEHSWLICKRRAKLKIRKNENRLELMKLHYFKTSVLGHKVLPHFQLTYDVTLKYKVSQELSPFDWTRKKKTRYWDFPSA